MQIHHRSLRNLARSILLVCVAGTALALQCSCNIVGPAYYVLKGPDKTPAVFALDSDRPTVVFVDDRASRLPRRSLREQIGQEAESTLIERDAVDQDKMIATQAALRVALSERYGASKSISEIGDAIGAEVIIYVTMDTFTISRDGVSLSQFIEARVKVLDVTAGERLFPSDEGGWPVRIERPVGTAQLPNSRAERNKAEIALARALGVEIAKLFYKHLTAQ